jgi:putative Ca2+/H+ antiporter (TMEM165/GDT1 family)
VKPYLTIFAAVLLAELGDKTQLATVLFASNTALDRWLVFAAAAAALIASTAVAVGLGSIVAERLPLATVRLVAAGGFIAIGVWMLVSR